MKKKILFLSFMALAIFLMPNSSLAFCTDVVPAKYKDAAENLFNSEVLKGNPDGSCTLEKGINRIEFAVMAMRAAEGDDDAKREEFKLGLFKDLTDSTVWYAKYAATAKKLGILKGDGQGNLRAIDPVNAAEAAVIAARAAGITVPAPTAGQQWYEPVFKRFKSNYVEIYDASYKMKRGDVVLMIDQVNSNYYALIEGDGDGPTTAPEVKSTPVTTTQPATTGSFKAVSSIRYLAENIQSLSSAQVNALLKGLNSNDFLNLSIYSAFGNLVHFKACETNPGLIMNINGNTNCAKTIQSWQFTMQMSNNDWAKATEYAYSQRDKLMIAIKCGTGEIDKASCSMYSGYTQQNNNTMDSIMKDAMRECSYVGQVLSNGGVCVSGS